MLTLKLIRIFHAPALALVATLCLAGSASALTIPLSVEFDAGTLGTYGSVEVTEVGGDLDFSVSLAGTTLGAGADLHEFYFNLVGSFTGLALSNTNAPTTAYVLLVSPSVIGGAGSSFEYGVGFGNGAGGPGNGVLKLASFRLSANEALSLASLEQTSSTSGGVTVNVAAHVQGTSLVDGVTSETVGGAIIPEPGTLALISFGLAGLGFAGRRR